MTPQLKKKTLALQAALTGGLRPHYAFLLRQQLQTIDHLTHQIAALDEQIAQVRAPLAPQHHLVCTVPGIAARASEAILAEIGTDMARFPSPGHLASWARVCPGTRESAGKRGVTTTGKANNWLRAALNEAAWAASRTKRSYYHALYHRMKARQGPKKAIGAVCAVFMLTAQSCPPEDPTNPNNWFGGNKGPAIACVLLDGYVRPAANGYVQCSFANRATNPSAAERQSCYDTIMISPHAAHRNYANHWF